MKNIGKVVILVLTLGTAFFVVACKSAPAASPAPSPASASVSPAPQDSPDQAAQNSLAAAKARAEAARKKTVDFESPSYFPSEWDAAEADYVAAGEQSSESLYNAAADSFEDIFRKAIPLYAQDREDAVIAARNEAISAGIDGLYPEHLRTADAVALDAADKYDAADYYAADTAAGLGLDMYQALKTGMDAYNARQDVLNRNFAEGNLDTFDQADEILVAAFDSFEDGNIEDALNGTREAHLRYNLILSAGWAAAAGKERQKAIDVKANIAVRNEFEPADKLYSQAAASLEAERYGESADLYSQSASRFIALAQTAVEKRRIAEEAIRAAEEKMAESEETARDAELILEGGV